MTGYGSTPQVNRYPEGAGIKRLFFSMRDVALIKDKTVQGGYGFLKAGTVMGVNKSDAGGVGDLVPFVPVSTSVVLGTDTAIGVAALVQDAASGSIKVSIADSYKFVVGDDLYLDNDDDEGPVKAAAITAIDRTTDTRYATITTTAFSHGDFTVAKSSYAYVQTSESDPYSEAAFILDKDIDTGTIGGLGALTSVLISNAILYKASLINASAAALTSLGAVEDGQHVIVK
jgi:hypothetical protein